MYIRLMKQLSTIMKAKFSFFPLLCLVLLLALPPQLAYSQVKIEFCPVCKRPKQNCPYKGNHPKPKPQNTAERRQRILDNLVSSMVYVEGGTFQMGSTSGDSEEKPVHQVTVSSFSIGATEVTQEQWEAVMGRNPSKFKGSTRPVEQVSWNDCQTFITKLNQLTGKKFRLPTEAEWEYAARGGNKSKGYTYSGSNTLDNVAWYDGNSNVSRHPMFEDYVTRNVATKSPNELGIYDMSGNVYEWCQDLYGWDYYSSSPSTNPTGPTSGSKRVLRGGGCDSGASGCRVANRGSYSPTNTDNDLGLRLAQ